MVEMEAIGPLLHAGLMLADLGADIVRVVRPSSKASDDGIDDADAGMLRGRTVVTADLTSDRGRRECAALIGSADVLMEGSRPARWRSGPRPGRLPAGQPGTGLRPDDGLGQEGPLAREAGHDVNYLALSGALEPLGPLASSLLKEVYNPKAVIPHAASLHQAFAHCAIFPTAASRRSLGRVSVPVWPVALSGRLPVVAW
ncbi:hypothetical protein GS845_11610 [Rhodococcus hoagii]|nr:hypothetical protein [Prescottella equi]